MFCIYLPINDTTSYHILAKKEIQSQFFCYFVITSTTNAIFTNYQYSRATILEVRETYPATRESLARHRAHILAFKTSAMQDYCPFLMLNHVATVVKEKL